MVVGLLWLLACVPEPRRESASAHTLCDYGAGEISSNRLSSENIDLKQVSLEISGVAGLFPNFEIREGDTRLASALIENERRVIIYKKDMATTAVSETGTRWSAYSVMAHEIAHHLLFHALTSEQSRFDQELAADEWSGYVLGKLGASLDETLGAPKHLAKEFGDATHPPRIERLKAVSKGWERARPVREWVVSEPMIFGLGTPVLQYDRVVFKKGASIRVVDGARFELSVLKEIVVEAAEIEFDGTGSSPRDADMGDWCPNCCGGGCEEWPARNDGDYDKANGDCSKNVDHQDNGLTRNGQDGGKGATIIVSGNRIGGRVKCKCDGGRGGLGGKRGPGKVHVKPNKDRFECPGDPHKNDYGRTGATGKDGTCLCPR